MVTKSNDPLTEAELAKYNAAITDFVKLNSDFVDYAELDDGNTYITFRYGSIRSSVASILREITNRCRSSLIDDQFKIGDLSCKIIFANTSILRFSGKTNVIHSELKELESNGTSPLNKLIVASKVNVEMISDEDIASFAADLKTLSSAGQGRNYDPTLTEKSKNDVGVTFSNYGGKEHVSLTLKKVMSSELATTKFGKTLSWITKTYSEAPKMITVTFSEKLAALHVYLERVNDNTIMLAYDYIGETKNQGGQGSQDEFNYELTPGSISTLIVHYSPLSEMRVVAEQETDGRTGIQKLYELPYTRTKTWNDEERNISDDEARDYQNQGVFIYERPNGQKYVIDVSEHGEAKCEVVDTDNLKSTDYKWEAEYKKLQGKIVKRIMLKTKNGIMLNYADLLLAANKEAISQQLPNFPENLDYDNSGDTQAIGEFIETTLKDPNCVLLTGAGDHYYGPNSAGSADDQIGLNGGYEEKVDHIKNRLFEEVRFSTMNISASKKVVISVPDLFTVPPKGNIETSGEFLDKISTAIVDYNNAEINEIMKMFCIYFRSDHSTITTEESITDAQLREDMTGSDHRYINSKFLKVGIDNNVSKITRNSFNDTNFTNSSLTLDSGYIEDVSYGTSLAIYHSNDNGVSGNMLVSIIRSAVESGRALDIYLTSTYLNDDN